MATRHVLRFANSATTCTIQQQRLLYSRFWSSFVDMQGAHNSMYSLGRHRGAGDGRPVASEGLGATGIQATYEGRQYSQARDIGCHDRIRDTVRITGAAITAQHSQCRLSRTLL